MVYFFIKNPGWTLFHPGFLFTDRLKITLVSNKIQTSI